MFAKLALFSLLLASATTGLGVSIVFGVIGAYYMVVGIVALGHDRHRFA